MLYIKTQDPHHAKLWKSWSIKTDHSWPGVTLFTNFFNDIDLQYIVHDYLLCLYDLDVDYILFNNSSDILQVFGWGDYARVFAIPILAEGEWFVVTPPSTNHGFEEGVGKTRAWHYARH